MANTNIKLFDENKSNMMSDIDYGKDTQRANGVQTGLASSQLQNKFQYQMSLMAYAVAQLMIANGYDAMDSAAVSTFVGNFSNSVVQKVKDKASASEAAAGTNDLKWISAKQLVDVATTIANEAAMGAVKYNTPQSLTDAQKQQARDNINAPAPYEAGDNISITGGIITTKAFPCNPNLLDNWYFGNPVNQRGQTSYAGTALYTIDRWRTNDTVTVVDGGIKIKRTTGTELFYQPLSDELLNAIAGKVVTYSALTTEGLFSVTSSCPTDVNAMWDTDDAVQGNFAVDLYGPNNSRKILRFYSLVDGTEATIIAAKLELGSQQTLAHQENSVWVLNEIPDYGEQLLKCQRYYRSLFKPNVDYAVPATATAEGVLHLDYALNPTMRTSPVLVGDTHGALRIVAYNMNDLSVAIAEPCDYIDLATNGTSVDRSTLKIVPNSGVSLVGRYCFTVDTFGISTQFGLSADL